MQGEGQREQVHCLQAEQLVRDHHARLLILIHVRLDQVADHLRLSLSGVHGEAGTLVVADVFEESGPQHLERCLGDLVLLLCEGIGALVDEHHGRYK